MNNLPLTIQINNPWLIYEFLVYFVYRQGNQGQGLNTFSLWSRRGREANQVNMDKTVELFF